LGRAMLFAVTLLTGRLAKFGVQTQLTWPKLVEMLGDSTPSVLDSKSFFARTKREQGELKDGPAWVPAHFDGGREDKTTGPLSCVVLDFDSIPRADESELWHTFEGYAGIIHTTASHTDAKPKVRVVLPLARPVAAKEWGATWSAVTKHFGLRGRIEADSKARNPSRLYYLPTHLSDVSPWAIHRDGAFLDALALPRPAPRAAAKAPTLKWEGDFARVARAYVQRLGPAVEGNGGDSLTYRVACLLFRDFGLSWTEGMDIFREWNNDCVPPWSDAELEAKATHALRYGTGEIGSKRTTGKNGKWDAAAVRAFVGSAQ
jgi:hypothetical protein